MSRCPKCWLFQLNDHSWVTFFLILKTKYWPSGFVNPKNKKLSFTFSFSETTIVCPRLRLKVLSCNIFFSLFFFWSFFLFFHSAIANNPSRQCVKTTHWNCSLSRCLYCSHGKISQCVCLCLRLCLCFCLYWGHVKKNPTVSVCASVSVSVSV